MGEEVKRDRLRRLRSTHVLLEKMSLVFSNRLLVKRMISRASGLSSSWRRSLLSSGYGCDDQWKQRLNQPLLTKISSDEFFAEVSQRYVKKLKVGAVDVDVFANVVRREEQLDELEHLLFRLRKTRRTKDMLESTHHAVCRAFLAHDALDRLMKILHKRTEFGIFPDHFCYNLLMDHFIRKKDMRSASRVAVLIMLQEDFSNQLSNRLALYSLHMYLKNDNREEWFEEGEVVAEESSEANDGEGDDEEDVEYVRIPYITNPYFDDHFDIKEPLHLCGKAMYMIGKEVGDVVGRSSQLLGLSLYNKWDKAVHLLEGFTKTYAEKLFARETIDRVAAVVESLPDDNPKSKKDASNFLGRLKEVESRASDEPLESLVGTLVEDKKLAELEAKDGQAMTGLFKSWEKDREKALGVQMEELLRDERMKEIQEKRKEMEEKEKMLFFFENFSRHEMDFVEAEKKITEMRAKSQVDEEYIPPKLRK